MLLLLLSAAHRKRLRARPLARILLALFHLLAELLRLLLVRKAEPRQTAASPSIVQFKRVKESAVLIPGPVLVNLLVPDDAPIRRRYIDQFHPECVPHQIICKHCGALQAGVGPSRAVRVCDIQLGDSNSLDLVGRFGNGALDRLFVLFCQDGRHCGWMSWEGGWTAQSDASRS